MKNLFLILYLVFLSSCSSSIISIPTEQLHVSVKPEQEPENWQELLPAQLEQVRKGVAAYKDIDAAKKAGWKAFGGDEPLIGQHFYLKDGPDYVAGDRLDFSKPSNLMYTEIHGEMHLTGVAFVVRIGKDEAVPAGFAGPQDVWHVHDALKAANAMTEGRPLVRGLAKHWFEKNYTEKGDDRYRMAMVHVWTERKNPDGVFAHNDRSLIYKKLNLPLEWAQGASLAEAKGLILAMEDGCESTIKPKAWMADLSRKQKRVLYKKCEASSERIKSVLKNHTLRDKETVNKTAGLVWQDFEVFRESIYSDEQQRRLNSLMEHDASHHQAVEPKHHSEFKSELELEHSRQHH